MTETAASMAKNEGNIFKNPVVSNSVLMCVLVASNWYIYRVKVNDASQVFSLYISFRITCQEIVAVGMEAILIRGAFVSMSVIEMFSLYLFLRISLKSMASLTVLHFTIKFPMCFVFMASISTHFY